MTDETLLMGQVGTLELIADSRESGLNGHMIVTKSGYEFSACSIVMPTVEMVKPVDWLWKPFLPKTMLVTSEGSSDLGKSLTWTDIAARLSSGNKLPDGTQLDKPIGVVFLPYEDDIEYAITPRLISAGANLSNIRIVPFAGNEPLQLDIQSHLELVEMAIEAVDAKLVIIDPITSAFSKAIDINAQADVRRGLAKLQDIARRRELTIVICRHHRKGRAGNMKEQGTGSNAFQEVPRAGIAFYPDPEDETGETKLFVHFKHNLSKRQKPRKYQIIDDNGTAKMLWLGESDLSDTQIYDNQRKTKVGELRLEILALFTPGLTLRTAEIAAKMNTRDESDYNTVVKTLGRMERAGELASPAKGTYCLPEVTPRQ
jgi:hypothetical protein